MESLVYTHGKSNGGDLVYTIDTPIGLYPWTLQ